MVLFSLEVSQKIKGGIGPSLSGGGGGGVNLGDYRGWVGVYCYITMARQKSVCTKVMSRSRFGEL